MVYESFDALNKASIDHNRTLGLIRPEHIVALRIRKSASTEWTLKEIEKLQSMQRQPSLFADQEHASIKRLEKMPFDFHYVYECLVDGELRSHTHKIVDWEASQLYRNLHRRHGDEGWEAPFWLIVSLIYPPKRRNDDHPQIALF